MKEGNSKNTMESVKYYKIVSGASSGLFIFVFLFCTYF